MNNDWLDIDVLEDYLDGKLDAKAMHFVEKQALEDPFVAEALEGLKQSPKRKQTLSILQKKLYDRISEKPVKRKLWGITTQRLSIAATATVAFIAVSILFFMRETNRRNAETAARRADGVVVNLDTNTAIAAAKPNLNSSTLIDKAIADVKTADLAKNNKSATTVKAAEIIAQNPLSKLRQKESFADKTEAKKEYLNEVMVTSSTADKVVFSGNVVDQRNGEAIQGAVVKISGTNKVTATDANGYFALPADSNAKGKDLVINALGFKETPVIGAQDPAVIREALSGNKSLNEIALLTGSNGRKKDNIPAPKIVLRAERNLNGKQTDEITKPTPVVTVDYQLYLETNNSLYNAKGPIQYVILSFRVKKNGRPTSIKVIKSLNDKADAEAKRLVRTGPDWILPKKGTDKVELSIRF